MKKNQTDRVSNGKQGQSIDRETLMQHLNEDLAGELQAICMYIQYSAMLTGANRKELRELFQGEIPDEQKHAQMLADKIAVWGGTPDMTPRPVPHASNTREMLEHVLEAEEKAIADYTTRAEEAEACGEIGLKVELENQIVDETKHKEEVQLILSGWTSGSCAEAESEHATAAAH